MGRYRENFTLYFRRRKNGDKIWYYKTYSPDGVRTCGKSTGLTSKAKARAYCEELFKKGKLWGGSCKLFGDFAEGFFDDNSPWFRDRMACGSDDCPALSQSYIETIRMHLRVYILPFFRDYKMEDLRPSITKLFRAELLEKGIKTAKGTIRPLAPKTVNNIVSTFRIITDAALADGVIMFDPLRTIRPLKGREKLRDIYELSELKKIIEASRGTCVYTPVIVGVCTGMRASEILALRAENVYENYIDVIDQLYEGEYAPLKTKEARKIPICSELYNLIIKDFPTVTYPKLSKDFQKVLFAAGLEFEKKKRGLCFHSLRHTLNTYLLAENVVPHKVAAIMGHSTGAGSMQERYTNWRADFFPEVYAAQEKLLKAILG